MNFADYQTESATVSKITTDGFGDETVASSFSVDIDPVFAFKRVFTSEHEEITGQSTIITSTSLKSNFDLTHEKWKLTYNGRDYQVEQPTPYYTPGTDRLEFIEVVLR